METKIYNTKGEETGKIKLPKEVFGLSWNDDLIHQVVVSLQSNKRTPVAHTKDRSDVSGGGKKPWRQKGTGRARHGSNRSPIWKGGGVTFGPRNEKDYSKKINKKMKLKALFVGLSRKLKENEIIFVDSINFDKPNAKEAKNIMISLSKVENFDKLITKKKNTALVAIGKNDLNIKKSFNNFGNIEVEEIRNLNIWDILKYKYLILLDPEKNIEVIKRTEKQVEN